MIHLTPGWTDRARAPGVVQFTQDVCVYQAEAWGGALTETYDGNGNGDPRGGGSLQTCHFAVRRRIIGRLIFTPSLYGSDEETKRF